MNPAIAVITPIVGLIGTLLGLWIGHRRWHRELAIKDSDRYKEELRVAYLELWDVVEDAHLKMRAAIVGLTPETFSGFLADVNNFMIRRGLFIERQDRHLVLEYLFWTNEYLRLLATTPQGRYLIQTTIAHNDLPTDLDILDGVKDRAVSLRNNLRSRIREVVGAPESSAWSTEVQPSAELLKQLDDLKEAITENIKERRGLVVPPVNQMDLEDDVW
jgi:hypothetical protein